MLVGHVKMDKRLVLSELRKCQATIDLDSMGIIHEYCMPFVDASTCLFHIKQSKITSSTPMDVNVRKFCLYRYMFRITTDDKCCTSDNWENLSEFEMYDWGCEIVQLKNLVFILGGYNLREVDFYSDNAMCYDMSHKWSKTWLSVGPMLNSRYCFGITASPSTNSIYAFGGYGKGVDDIDNGDHGLSSCEVYQVDGNEFSVDSHVMGQWKALPSIDEKKSRCYSVLHRDKIYLFAYGRTDYLCFDTVSQSWLPPNDDHRLPFESDFDSIVSDGSYIYVVTVGPADGKSDLDANQVHRCNTETNQWSKVVWKLPEPDCSAVRFLDSDSILFAVKDRTAYLESFKAYWIYSVSSGTRKKLPHV